MTNKTIMRLAGASFILATLIPSAIASETQSHMRVKGLTSQPIGHYNYCKQFPSDCRIKAGNTAPPKLTRERWKQMVQVNGYSNDTVRPVTDMELYQTEELWAYPTNYGDCEDYVLMKRHMLMQKGWPANALLITVVRQPNGEGHAVLTVRTDRADYILDNMNSKILPWNETRYTYLKRQATEYSGHWASIADDRG